MARDTKGRGYSRMKQRRQYVTCADERHLCPSLAQTSLCTRLNSLGLRCFIPRHTRAIVRAKLYVFIARLWQRSKACHSRERLRGRALVDARPRRGAHERAPEDTSNR